VNEEKENATGTHEQSTWGVGPYSGDPAKDPNFSKFDPELLANGDTRNVVDVYRYWSMEAIVADLDTKRHGYHVAIENWQHDLNIGSIVRTANAFMAKEVHIIGNRRWNRRGAMVTDRYQHVTPLRNARNDAQSFSKELQAAGFQVTTVLDGTREQMHDQIDGFLRRIEKGDEVVFFFSGHGSQPPQLGPYLLPVDIKVTGERAIQRTAAAAAPASPATPPALLLGWGRSRSCSSCRGQAGASGGHRATS
jgi:hypothetical protein